MIPDQHQPLLLAQSLAQFAVDQPQLRSRQTTYLLLSGEW